MAIQVVETKTAKINVAATSLQTAAFVTNPVVGNTIVVVMSTFTQPTHQAPTDTASNTYTQIGSTVNVTAGGNTYSLSMWRSENIAGGASFKVTGHVSASTTFITMTAYNVSGAATPTSYNADVSSNTGNSTSPAPGLTSPAPTTTSLFIGGMVSNTLGTATDPSGWTGVDQTDNVSFVDLYTAYLISSSAQNPTWTQVSNNWGAICASFAQAGPPPANSTCAGAIAVGSTLPYTTTQNVNVGGTTYTVFYSYTAVAGDVVIGAFAFGDLVNYSAQLQIFSPDCVTSYLSIAGTNVPVQFPVTPGTTYFFKISSVNGNIQTASLSFSVRRAPALPAPVGSLLVNDDTVGFPLAFLSATDGTVLHFQTPFPASENADITNTGILCVQDNNTGSPAVYDQNLKLILATSIAFAGVISTNKTTKFYVGDGGGGMVKAKVTTLSLAGVQGPTTWTFASAGLTGMAPSLDESTLYYTGSASSLNASVKQWDLKNNVALADLVSGGIATYVTNDIVVLSDGTLLVLYFKASVGTTVKHYSAAGATLNTYNFTTLPSATITRICRALDDPNSFWIFLKLSNGSGRFTNVKVADGTTITTFDALEFEGGTGQAAAAATPSAYFGHSMSCPLLILRPPGVGQTGIDARSGPPCSSVT